MKKTLTILTLLLVFFSYNIKIKALTNISINGVSLVPEFNINTKVYNAFVSSKTEIIGINVTKEENEIITGSGSISLKKGLNVIEIISYKENKKEVYTLNITRGEVKTNKKEALLKELKVGTFDIDFKSDVLYYTVEASDLDNYIEISYTPTNPNNKVTLKGSKYLTKKENIIEIKVTSQDKKTTNTYTLKILKNIKTTEKQNKQSIFDKKEFSSFELKLIRIALFSLVLLIMVILFYFIFIKKYKTFKLKPFKLKHKK